MIIIVFSNGWVCPLNILKVLSICRLILFNYWSLVFNWKFHAFLSNLQVFFVRVLSWVHYISWNWEVWTSSRRCQNFGRGPIWNEIPYVLSVWSVIVICWSTCIHCDWVCYILGLLRSHHLWSRTQIILINRKVWTSPRGCQNTRTVPIRQKVIHILSLWSMVVVLNCLIYINILTNCSSGCL